MTLLLDDSSWVSNLQTQTDSYYIKLKLISTWGPRGASPGWARWRRGPSGAGRSLSWTWASLGRRCATRSIWKAARKWMAVVRIVMDSSTENKLRRILVSTWEPERRPNIGNKEQLKSSSLFFSRWPIGGATSLTASRTKARKLRMDFRRLVMKLFVCEPVWQLHWDEPNAYNSSPTIRGYRAKNDLAMLWHLYHDDQKRQD